MRPRLFGGDVCNEFAVTVLRAKHVQKTPNVDLIAGEVTANRMSINGKAHEPYQYSGAVRHAAVLKVQLGPSLFPCKLLLKQ